MQTKVRDYPIILLLFITIASGCNDCRDNDCGGDDFITIHVIGDAETSYTDSLAFYYYDENQQRVEADIYRDRYSSQRYSAYLDYRGAEPLNTFHVALGNQVKTIDIDTRYDQDRCCGDYLRFEKIQVDGRTVSLPIEITVD